MAPPAGRFRPWRNLAIFAGVVAVLYSLVYFTGGAAFSDKWSGHAQDEHHWRDSHVRMEGPIVNALLVNVFWS